MTSAQLQGDNPIKTAAQDRIGRDATACTFAKQILHLDAHQGFVVGVLGRWGSGKTSFLNLTRAELERAEIPVLDFNPWMFSGAEQLVTAFFDEISSQLRLKPKLSDLAESFEAYGDAISGLDWIPVAGTFLKAGGSLAKLFGNRLKNRERGLGGRRKSIETALRSLDKPIAVVIDDVDRLTTTEIRDIFKLVRLTANFPNIIYLVAFDRARVEQALDEDRFNGRAYLEKILQLVVDLPNIPERVIQSQTFAAIDASLANIADPGPFDTERWPDIYAELVRPLIATMRDVRRYALAVHGTVADLNGQVSLVDVLALEAIRLFLPDVFLTLHRSMGVLTSFSDRGHDSSHLKRSVESIVEAAGNHAQVVTAMIRKLFPAAEHLIGGSHYDQSFRSRWLRDRRVAHSDLLGLYLERVAGESLTAFMEAEKAFGLMDDAQQFDQFLRALQPERREDVIASLENHEDGFSPTQVVPAVAVLLNIIPDLPERPRGMFELEAQFVVRRVVYRLLRTLDSPDAAEQAIRTILPRLQTISAKFELIAMAGHREGRGHKFISESVALELERAWRAELRLEPVDRLKCEPELFGILALAQRYAAEDGAPAVEISDDPALTLAILKTSRSIAKSQTMGSRAVKSSPRLPWDELLLLFGSEEAIRNRLELVEASTDEDKELLALASRYLDGWRPGNFDDD